MNEKSNLGAASAPNVDPDQRLSSNLPRSELDALLTPYLQPLIEIFQQIHLLRRAFESWVDEHRETILRVGQAVHEVAAGVGKFIVELDAASRQFAELLREMERVAGFGWTLPTNLTVPELIDFFRFPDEDAIAVYMLQRQKNVDADWSRTEARLCGDQHLAEFRTVLPQCFRAVRTGDYAIAVPNLIAMLERAIQTLNPPDLQASTNVLKTLHEKGVIAAKAQEDLFCGAIWLSLLKVVSSLWGTLPLNIPDGVGLSRHGVQHGRTEPPNSQVEILRLLNAIETALALHALIREDRNFPRSSDIDVRKLQPAFALIQANLFLPRSRGGVDETKPDGGTRTQ